MKGKKNLALAAIGALLAVALFAACKMEVAEEEVLTLPISPYISVSPASASYDAGAATLDPLKAQVWDWKSGDGRLSYQWYGFEGLLAFIAGNAAGAPIETSDGSGTISPADAVDSEGIKVNTVELDLGSLITLKTAGSTYYYYLEITNASSKKTVRSEIATVAFNSSGTKLPVITRQPASGAYQLGRSLVLAELSARATSPDSGSLTYQWYYAFEDDLEGLTSLTTGDLTEIDGATGAAYRPTLDHIKPGKNYFFVEITNWIGRVVEGDGTVTVPGTPSDPLLSVPALIDMAPGSAALEPVITVQPVDRVIFAGDATIPPLTVEAERPLDAGTLSYQWYRNSAHSARGGTSVGADNGGNTESFTPPDNGSTSYYYVVVTNTATIRSGTGRANTSSRAVRVVYGTPGQPVANMTVTVRDPRNAANRFQYVRGYGGMDTAWANFPEQLPADMETMYNPDWGLGYNINRIMISPGNTNVNISIRDLINSHRPHYYDNVKIVNKYGGYNLASPWSPPKEWKSNNSINGGGNLIHAYYQQYADYLRAFAKHMYDAGAPIYAISISNEPNYTAGYDGCEWEPDEMEAFFRTVNPQPFTRGIRGYGGGRDIDRVLTVNGESANTPYINIDALRGSVSRSNIDLLARHVYGETTKTLWRVARTGGTGTAPSTLTGANNFSAVSSANPPTILLRDDGTMYEVWMTEHNINSANATAYPNDSTWNYVWRYMNDVDLVMRLNNENAFVWWASKRFYSMVGDGQFGTRNGAALPRGIGLSHYAKYTIDTHRVNIQVGGVFADGSPVGNLDLGTSAINSSTFNLDNTSVRITAYASIKSGKDNKRVIDFHLNEQNEIGFDDEIEFISLVMWTPTTTQGATGRNMGTVELKMPAGFLIGGVSAHKSRTANNMFEPETVTVSADRTSAFVTGFNAGQILSVKLTRQ